MTEYGRLETCDFRKMGYDKAEKYVLDIMEENGDCPEISWRRVKGNKKGEYLWKVTEFSYDTTVVGCDKFDCLCGIYDIYADKEFREIEIKIGEDERRDMEMEYQAMCCPKKGVY